MSQETDRLRAKIEKLRLSIDCWDAELSRAMTNRARDTLWKRRLEAGDELQSLWAQLERLHSD